jgi:lipopolysaccharide export system protein LptA
VTRRLRLLASVALVGALAALLTISGTPAQAGPLATVEGQSLDVKADKLDVDVDKGTATLEGNVRAAMGDLEVLSPKIEIKYDEAPRVRWARGSGGVKMRVKGIEAASNTVVVDLAKRVVNLSGGVRLTRGRGWVQADRASVDLATHKVTLHEVKGSIPVEPPAR